jgi:hypothetical protein
MKSLALLFVLCSTAFAAEIRVQQHLWSDPGRVEARDLFYGPGGRSGAPRPPFRLIREEKGGTSTKLLVRDARRRLWEVKFGKEGKAEVLATRIVWSLGYYADPTYLVRRGRISGGLFRDGRFELRDPRSRFRPDLEWSWKRNPFEGTRELNGLRILVMLLSNWDNKDSREQTSNTGVLERRITPTLLRRTYYLTDWGASMGQWGGFFTREKWDCEEFARQSSKLVKDVDDGEIRWGFKGKHDGDFKDDLTISDARWLMQYLGRLRDAQLAAAVRASGADGHENACFVRSLRTRIESLRRVANRSLVAGAK